jgi:hypothetical protein
LEELDGAERESENKTSHVEETEETASDQSPTLQHPSTCILARLPLEIQELIFKLLLVDKSRPIELCKNRGEDYLRHLRFHVDNDPLGGKDGFADMHETKAGSGIRIHKAVGNLGVLRMSGLVREAAELVLYGKSTFKFSCTAALELFLQQPPPRLRAQLRHIAIGRGGYRASNIRSALNLLKEATNLESPVFDESMVCGLLPQIPPNVVYRAHIPFVIVRAVDQTKRRELARFVGDLRPLLTVLGKMGRAANLRGGEDIWRIVSVAWVGWKCPYCKNGRPISCLNHHMPLPDDVRGRCQAICGNMAEHGVEVTRLLQEALRKDLVGRDRRIEG